MKRTIQFILFSALSSAIFAGDINICSTGFSTATTSGCGPAINSPNQNNLTPDGNWYQASNSSGTFMGQAYVTVNNVFPVQNAGAWLANNADDSNGIGAGSSWITPSNNQQQAFINGQYYFATNFALTAQQTANASISGYWLASTYGSGIFLNGVEVGQSSLPAFGGLGGPMVPFNIAQGNPAMGQAVFVGGQNVLTFGNTNDSTDHGVLNNIPGPTGVRVLFTSASDGVPEPGTLFLMGSGLIGGGLLARRRRRVV